ncbi:DUF5343 domain-containing protein [Janthinobacterium sp. SUN206]|uniref:DUF5343 domain-containing protein n=1 Tax=Janthinobacterium sp. SUN206 TaxID=3014787 RepID=UPI002713F966|nr:DUF5343 domain-containing protein [Janthinobacterium sp. SUN206]MDO8067986.1 DUF5343 domain-containing protein [Janthinobacterium sp. SUN206]
MATVVSYPKISRNTWSKLRVRFKKSIPAVVTPAFVSSIVTMADASAVSNVIKPLQVLGLLDDQRKPTDLASQWRHDDEYPTVCKTIRERIYPQDLLDTYPGGEAVDKPGIIRWFMKSAGVGDAAAKMFADTYSILAQADAAQLEEMAANSTSTKKRGSTSQAARKSTTAQAKESVPTSLNISPAPTPPIHHKPLGKFPAVHIDVQVHISPETSAEQIDRIFESMAKHLGNFTG